MVKKKLLIIFILALNFNSFEIIAQTNRAIKNKNSELHKIKSEIANLENKLLSKAVKTKKSEEAFATINQQTLLLNKLINRIIKDEKGKEKLIKNLNIQIKEIQNQVKQLQNEYSKYIVWIYKKNLKSEMGYLIESDNYNQALLRLKYLHLISESNKNIVENLRAKTEKLNVLNKKYKLEVKRKQSLVDEKNKERKYLSKKKLQKQKVIDRLKDDQEALSKEIEKKRMSELVIKKIIAKLTEDERQRRELLKLEKLKNKHVAPELDYSYDKFENFGQLKGKLKWPVKSGKIIRNFGENRNEKLNTVTLNYGIDIDTRHSIPVKAISSGRVSIIDWIPGYGSVIIITHKDNYRTVYGHLTDITVVKDDEIKAGEKLGEVNESLEGNILHFEIWKERIYQNPIKWLVKK